MDLHDYEIVAENYDRYTPTLASAAVYAQFIEYHVALSDKHGQGGVLDIACGTGNVAIPLARAGHDVWAFDASNAMMKRLRSKMDDLDDKTRSRIHISVQDMIDFSFDRQFSLAMIPGSGFMHLITPDDQRKALVNIHSHLEAGGMLTFNTFDPSLKRIVMYSGGEHSVRKRTEFQSENGNRMEIHESTTYEPENQLIHSVWTFREFGPDNRQVSETKVPLEMRYSFRQETKHLLEIVGFSVVQLYGSYDKRQPGYPSNLIWLAKKT